MAPSRFGYLRSEAPPDPSSENQADAFVDLLDHLGVASAAVIGGSAGALSALQFAIRHPDRLNALIALVPASYAPGRPPVRPSNRIAQAIIDYALKSDAVFWAGTKLAETRMIGALLATDAEVFNESIPEERSRARAILRNILPISRRAIGLGIDARLSGNPKPMAIAEIRAPTLAISLEDDRFETAAAARHIAATVPGAKLMVYPIGGHIWLGHNGNVFAAIDSFLSRELGSSDSQEIR
jgi:pimeloyl-ACP methyl ester carboxylesterase